VLAAVLVASLCFCVSLFVSCCDVFAESAFAASAAVFPGEGEEEDAAGFEVQSPLTCSPLFKRSPTDFSPKPGGSRGRRRCQDECCCSQSSGLPEWDEEGLADDDEAEAEAEKDDEEDEEDEDDEEEEDEEDEEVKATGGAILTMVAEIRHELAVKLLPNVQLLLQLRSNGRTAM